jgi:hypothetical protein
MKKSELCVCACVSVGMSLFQMRYVEVIFILIYKPHIRYKIFLNLPWSDKRHICL